MKIRLGFVSNSSSSSFCILGVVTDDEKMKTFYDENYNYKELSMHYGISEYCDEDLIIGVSAQSIKDDETILQAKQRVVEELNEMQSDKKYEVKDISWHEDGGFEG